MPIVLFCLFNSKQNYPNKVADEFFNVCIVDKMLDAVVLSLAERKIGLEECATVRRFYAM